ncbi:MULTISPECIES: hypothetical protein [unclassified Psychrobacter]|uniref:hypothetical protein n=1 Tax=unclassified Psychrobacter TaxID=196806 RepID=UPI003F48A860
MNKKYKELVDEYKGINLKINKLENTSSSAELDKNLEGLINSYYDSPEKVNTILSKTINDNISDNFKKYYKDFDSKGFINSEFIKYENYIAENDNENLLEIQKQEYKSAFSLRNKMINLFSFSVFAMILSFFLLIFLKSDVFSIQKYIVVISLFLSLGFFVIYIIKSSNSRTSTLMSIYENQRNYQNIINLISKLDIENGITDNDLEIIKMMSINYSGREKRVSHPYEIILKGLSNSNIQFNGGKMSLDKNSETKEN